jgi:hypothetical protein
MTDITRQRILDQLDADRRNASQASREVAELDVLSVHFVIQAHLKAGRTEEARAIVAQWKAGQL